MQLLHKRNIGEMAKLAPLEGHRLSALDRQSAQLVGHFETLLRRMMRQGTGEEPGVECSREELRAMVLLGSAGRVIMSALAADLGVPLSTATHTVDRLVAKGLVLRVRSEEDRRVVLVEMSPFGKQLEESFRKKRSAMARSWLEPLSPGEREIFLELMAKIAQLAKPAVSERKAEPAHRGRKKAAQI